MQRMQCKQTRTRSHPSSADDFLALTALCNVFFLLQYCLSEKLATGTGQGRVWLLNTQVGPGGLQLATSTPRTACDRMAGAEGASHLGQRDHPP